MYKEAKRTLVDLNTTKIYLLKTIVKRHCISIKLVFSVNIQDYCYKIFLQDTLQYTTPDTTLFKLEDYEQYLADKCEYDLIKDKERMLFIKHTEEDTKHGKQLGYSTLYMCPSPHLNLLEQKVEGLIQYNHTKLRLDSSGLFTYQEFVDNSNTTRGIIKDLKRVQQGKNINTTSTNASWLHNALSALDLHWN